MLDVLRRVAKSSNYYERLASGELSFRSYAKTAALSLGVGASAWELARQHSHNQVVAAAVGVVSLFGYMRTVEGVDRSIVTIINHDLETAGTPIEPA